MDTRRHHPAPLPGIAEILLWSDPSSIRPPSLLGDPSSGAALHTRTIARDSHKELENVQVQGGSYRNKTTINMLPDDVLLDIFDFCQEVLRCSDIWKWHLLVRVCRRWRQIIFESPHRLNLQILCTLSTPTRENLGIWPPFPIIIDYDHPQGSTLPSDDDNIIAALEHRDRVHLVTFFATGQQLGKIAATVMLEPFPVLTHLRISSIDGNASALPAKFLGGFAPCLRSISLGGIPFPALPTLLLSTSDLVSLNLRNIPPTGYIPPEEMAACLAALPSLEKIAIGFESATSRPDRMAPPPVTPSVLPSLIALGFEGASEYLEDLISRIDSPQLIHIFTKYLDQPVDFQVSQLFQFICRSFGPELTLFRQADINFLSDSIIFGIWETPESDGCSVVIVVPCEEIDWQFQLLSQFSAILSNVVHLELSPGTWEVRQFESADDAEWLRFLRQYHTVQMLEVQQGLARYIALALEGITEEMVTEVLPSLNLIYLEGYSASSIETFVAVRQRADRPVAVVDTKEEFGRRLESYFNK